MATIYGTNGTITQVNGGKVPSNLQYGSRRAWLEGFELSGAAIDDVLWIGEFTDAAVLLPQSSITFDALGTGVELDVVAIDPDGTITTIVDGIPAASAGVARLDTATYVDSIPYALTSDNAGPVKLALIVKGGAATGTLKASFEISTD